MTSTSSGVQSRSIGGSLKSSEASAEVAAGPMTDWPAPESVVSAVVAELAGFEPAGELVDDDDELDWAVVAFSAAAALALAAASAAALRADPHFQCLPAGTVGLNFGPPTSGI